MLDLSADGKAKHHWGLRSNLVRFTLIAVVIGDRESYFQQHAFDLCQSWFLGFVKETSELGPMDALPASPGPYFHMMGMSPTLIARVPHLQQRLLSRFLPAPSSPSRS